MSMKWPVLSALPLFALLGGCVQQSAYPVYSTVETTDYWGPEETYVYPAPRPIYRPRYRDYPRPRYYNPGSGPIIYNKEAAKDYVKSRRRAQEELRREQTRAWNRANGF